MGAVKLRRLLTRGTPPLLDVLEPLLEGGHLRDPNGRVVAGTGPEDPDARELHHDGQIVGWAHRVPPDVVAMVESLIALEGEFRDLASDALDRYRELALLTTLSEGLSEVIEPDRIAERTLAEVMRVSAGDAGTVVVGDTAGPRRTLAAAGTVSLDEIAVILSSHSGDLIEAADVDPRTAQWAHGGSFVFARLAAGAVDGTIVLWREGAPYRAPELKLLVAVTSQLTPLLNTALAAEEQSRRTSERTLALERELDELKAALASPQRSRRVEEVTSSDYFRRMRLQADELRDIVDGTTAADERDDQT